MAVAVADTRRFMSEERADYHTADDSAGDAQPDNVRVLPARGGFAQIDNAYFDRLIGVISPTTYYCLMYLVRRTVGYRTDSVKASLGEIAEATQLSRHTVIKALDELKSASIIASDAEERGRTQVRTLTLMPVTDWRVTAPASSTACPTSAKSALVSETPQLVQNLHQTRSKNALVSPSTSAKNAPLLNTKRNTNLKDNDADASRTADADATPATPSSSEPSPAKTIKRTRKLTDEQLEAHRAEQGYIADLLAAIKAETHTKTLPTEGRERQAAHWFYRAHDGESAPIEDVMTCYRLTKRAPFWRGKYLSLQHLEGCYVAYHADPAAYERENPANGRRPASTRPEPPRQPMRSVPPLNAKPPQLD